MHFFQLFQELNKLFDAFQQNRWTFLDTNDLIGMQLKKKAR